MYSEFLNYFKFWVSPDTYIKLFCLPDPNNPKKRWNELSVLRMQIMNNIAVSLAVMKFKNGMFLNSFFIFLVCLISVNKSLVTGKQN